MKIRVGYLLFLIAVMTILLRLIVLPYANGTNGNPVDIYYVDREAAKLVAELRDPYLYSNYTNHYGGVVTFAYLPLIPIYFAPFVFIGADIRYGSIIADVITALATYFVAKSILQTRGVEGWIPFSGSIAYAILPVSIWLTSVIGSNLMIGSMLLMAALAALFEEKELLAGVFLGLGFAANQFVILVLPIVALHCVRRHNLRTPIFSILVSSATVLPFVLYSPWRFLDDVLLFQFERPAQQNGIWSLYYLVRLTTGFEVGALLRIIIFLVPASIATLGLFKTREKMLLGIVTISALSAFVLPLDGFWSYFLLPMTVCCALVPFALVGRGQTGGSSTASRADSQQFSV